MSQQIDVPGMGVVEFPDGMSDADITSAIQKNMPKPEPGSSLAGVGKSLASGLGEGVAGLAGLPGDLYHLGLRALGDKLTPESSFGSNAIKKGIEGYTGEFYKPQGTAEELASKIGQFAPAMIGGPETAAVKLATRVAAPAVASEVGGKVAGPYGELAGALIGAGGASAAANRFKEMAAARNAVKLPTGDQLLKAGGSQFDAARDMNVVVSPEFSSKAAADMRAALRGFDPEANKAVFAAADRLESLGSSKPPSLSQTQKLELEMNGLPPPSAKPTPVAMNDVDFVRKELVSLKTSPDGSVREAARKAIASLQKSQTALKQADTLAGDAAAFTKTTQDAIGNWSAGRRAQTIEGKANLAELNLNSPVGGLDMASHGQALQRTMKQLARPINNTNVPIARKLGFNNEEVAAITSAANGNRLTNLGDIANQVIPHWAAGGAAASALRAMGGLSVKRQVSALDSLVRSRSPLAAQVAAQLPAQITQQLSPKTQALLTAMIAADPVLSKQGQPVGQPNTY